jgi:hypothetical protein
MGHQCDNTRRRPVKEPKEDDERLSALLEGRVQGGQREGMLAHLAAAEDDYEVFTGTARVLRALEEEDARARRPPVVPSMGRGGWRAPELRTVVVVVTGTVVLLLGLGWVLLGRSPSDTQDPFQLAMRADPAVRGLPVDWKLPAPSGAARGQSSGARRDARAVNAGAMLVDLAVAVRARDTGQTQMLAERLSGQLDPGANDTPLQRISDYPGAPMDSLTALLAQATARLSNRRKPLELGAWLEAARLAASARNSDFFQDGVSGGMLGRAERTARGDEATLRAVAEVRAALPAGSAPRWEALEQGLGRLLSELSG